MSSDDRGPVRRRTALDQPLRSESLPSSVTCPFCESADTTQFSAFGGQASTSQYYCNGCRTVFELMRWR